MATFSRVARLSVAVMLLIAGAFLPAAATSRMLLQGKDNGDGFVVYTGLKCEDKDDSYYTKEGIESIQDCIKLCKSDKHEDKCALVQFHNSKCTLWEEDECSHSEEAEDFVMAGKPSNKKTKFFHVPKSPSTDQGFDCEGNILMRLKDVDLKECLKECRDDKDCVAVNRWKDYGLEDFWRCTLYTTCNEVSECYECGETYIREA